MMLLMQIEASARDAPRRVDDAIDAFSRQLAARLAERPPYRPDDVWTMADSPPPGRLRSPSVLLALAFCLGAAALLSVNFLFV